MRAEPEPAGRADRPGCSATPGAADRRGGTPAAAGAAPWCPAYRRRRCRSAPTSRPPSAVHGRPPARILGVSIADRLPSLTLVGAIGANRLRVGGSTVIDHSWSFGPSITLPLFDGGRRAAAVEAARARYDAAAAAYRGRVRLGGTRGRGRPGAARQHGGPRGDRRRPGRAPLCRIPLSAGRALPSRRDLAAGPGGRAPPSRWAAASPWWACRPRSASPGSRSTRRRSAAAGRRPRPRPRPIHESSPRIPDSRHAFLRCRCTGLLILAVLTTWPDAASRRPALLPVARPVMTVEAVRPQAADWPLRLMASGEIAPWQESVIASRSAASASRR